MNRKKISLGAALAVMALAPAVAETNEVAALDVKAGADVRLRYDVTKGLPNANHGEDPHSDYSRIRIRPWMQVGSQSCGLYARLADEFRYYRRPESKSRKQQFPDVLFIDNLYWYQNGILDAFDLKVGRQDMAFGSRRIISDGNGGDGSRSTYFDAVRLTYHVDETRTLDAFAFYNVHRDWLPTLGKEHENGKKAHAYDMNGYFQDEMGGGLYWQDRSCKDLGYDLYYVAKDEIRGHRAKYRSEGRHAQTHTAGVRLLPRFTDTLTGEAEAAVQAGDNGLFAGQGYSGVTYQPKADWKPYLTGAIWGLTGDSDGDRGDHAWHSVFNRETGMGETIVPMYNKYNYNNILYPHLAAGCEIGAATKLKGQTGPVFAPVSENRADGGDYGNYRGFYMQVKCEMKLDKLTGHGCFRVTKLTLHGEYFEKGNYFVENADSSALFGRCELSWKF
ncbi:MAG: hypothetical protein ACI4Q3_01900 [Kiritimatiellia bacterium]